MDDIIRDPLMSFIDNTVKMLCSCNNRADLNNVIDVIDNGYLPGYKQYIHEHCDISTESIFTYIIDTIMKLIELIHRTIITIKNSILAVFKKNNVLLKHKMDTIRYVTKELHVSAHDGQGAIDYKAMINVLIPLSLFKSRFTVFTGIGTKLFHYPEATDFADKEFTLQSATAFILEHTVKSVPNEKEDGFSITDSGHFRIAPATHTEHKKQHGVDNLEQLKTLMLEYGSAHDLFDNYTKFLDGVVKFLEQEESNILNIKNKIKSIMTSKNTEELRKQKNTLFVDEVKVKLLHQIAHAAKTDMVAMENIVNACYAFVKTYKRSFGSEKKTNTV